MLVIISRDGEIVKGCREKIISDNIMREPHKWCMSHLFLLYMANLQMYNSNQQYLCGILFEARMKICIADNKKCWHP